MGVGPIERDPMTDEKRQVVFWECHQNAEVLHHETKNEAIENYLDGIDLEDEEETVLVYGFARMVAPKPNKSDADYVVEDWFETHWEEFIGEDVPDITARMNEAALTFLTVLHDEFVPWACEEIESDEINVADWIKENRPDWLKDKPKEI